MSIEGTPEPSEKGRRSYVWFLVLGLVVLAALSGAEILVFDAHPTHYGCMSFSYSGSTIDVSTSGLIHVVGSQYYVSCNEGTDDGNLPSTTFSNSCLTVTPKLITSQYPAAKATYYYYVAAAGHTVALENAPANSTEILQPTNAYIQVNCS